MFNKLHKHPMNWAKIPRRENLLGGAVGKIITPINRYGSKSAHHQWRLQKGELFVKGANEKQTEHI
jgi:hypothetical protein